MSTPLMLICLFLAGSLGLMGQIGSGQLPQSTGEWIWLVIYILSLVISIGAPLIWYWRGPQIMEWLNRMYEETSPRRKP